MEAKALAMAPAPVSTELKFIIALSHFPNAMKEEEEEKRTSI